MDVRQEGKRKNRKPKRMIWKLDNLTKENTQHKGVSLRILWLIPAKDNGMHGNIKGLNKYANIKAKFLGKSTTNA